MSVKEEAAKLFHEMLVIGAGADDEDFEPPFAQYADDPVGFAREELNVDLWGRQEEILLSVRDNRETNVPAAHGVGKTFDAAVLTEWWVFSVGGLVISSAPRQKQVRDLLWREIRNLHRKWGWKLGGICDLTQLKVGGDPRAWGFVASEFSEESFGGRHHPHLLVIIDEASGVSKTAEEGLTGNITGRGNRLLRIGNPLADGTPFSAACNESKIKVPVWEHPNVRWAYYQDPDSGHYVLRPKVAKEIIDADGKLRPFFEWPEEYRAQADSIPGGPSVQWIEDQRGKATRKPGTPFWVSRLDAEFPTEVEGTLVPRSWFDEARERYDRDPEHWDERAANHDWTHGGDVGDGGDPHAFVSRRGPVLYRARQVATIGDRQDVSRAEGEMVAILRDLGGEVRVDQIGVGSGALSGLKEQGLAGVGVNFGQRWPEPEKGDEDAEFFLNTRAQCYLDLRDAFESGEIAIAPLGEEEEILREELAAVRRDSPTSTGRLRIEKKDKIKSRLGRSPNLADALAMTYAREIPGPPKKRVRYSIR